jgi:predicted acyl esterase
MYLDQAGVIADLPPGAPSLETFVADPDDPIGTVGGGLLSFGPLQPGPQDAAPLFAQTAGTFLSFETAALVSDLPIAGDITLTLRLSLDSTNSAPADCDVAAWLIDDDGLGSRLIVANGIVRLSEYLAKQGGQSVNLDTPYNVTFSLGSRAYNFATGHKLVLYVAGSNSPMYAVNPGNGDPLPGVSPSIVQEINLHYGQSGGQCQLLLPLLGP